jgi:outer membrane lipoprotein SlyB
MENIQSSKRIHPAIAIAAGALTVVCLVGAAAIAGLLPTSHGATAPEAPYPVASATYQRTKVVPVTKRPEQHSEAIARRTEKPAVADREAICVSCGTVESVRSVTQAAPQGSGLGAVAGAVVGGALGNQVGGGNGRKLATVAGAIGGGFAGNAIEKQARGATHYEVHVRMEDGSAREFSYENTVEWTRGDLVRVVNGKLRMQG